MRNWIDDLAVVHEWLGLIKLVWRGDLDGLRQSSWMGTSGHLSSILWNLIILRAALATAMKARRKRHVSQSAVGLWKETTGYHWWIQCGQSRIRKPGSRLDVVGIQFWDDLVAAPLQWWRSKRTCIRDDTTASCDSDVSR